MRPFAWALIPLVWWPYKKRWGHRRTQGGSCENSGRRQLSTSQGDKPQKKPTLHTLISDFWTPESWVKKCLVLKPLTRFPCHGSPGKRLHLANLIYPPLYIIDSEIPSPTARPKLVPLFPTLAVSSVFLHPSVSSPMNLYYLPTRLHNPKGHWFVLLWVLDIWRLVGYQQLSVVILRRKPNVYLLIYPPSLTLYLGKFHLPPASSPKKVSGIWTYIKIRDMGVSGWVQVNYYPASFKRG